MDQWIGEVDKKSTEKELKQLLEMEFRNVLSYVKLPQERGDSKGIEEDLEVSSTVRSRKLTLSYRCLQWPRTKELSKIASSRVRAKVIEMDTRLLHNVSWSHFQKFYYEQKNAKCFRMPQTAYFFCVLRSIPQTNSTVGTMLLLSAKC